MRLQLPYFDTPEKGSHDEKETMKPFGNQGVWWQESLRILASMEKYVLDFYCLLITNTFSSSLNLVILRVGFLYGPYIDYSRSRRTINISVQNQLNLVFFQLDYL